MREKTTFRRGRSNRGQRNYYQSRRGRGNKGYRRNQQRNHTYRKRPKEDTNILTKQDFFNVGLLVLERGFEQNGLEEIVQKNPDVFVEKKRGIIVDTRKEFKKKMKNLGQKENKLNSRNKVIGSVLDNLRQEEELPQWYQDDDEEFGEEMLMEGFKKSDEVNVEEIFKEWKEEEQEKTVVVMESLLHGSSDEENEEWGGEEKKLEESGLNLHLDKEFTLESLAGQTEEIEQQMNKLRSKDALEEEKEEEENEDNLVDLKSLSLLGKFIDEKETYFDDLDKQIEESFMISKQEKEKPEKKEVGKVLEDAWKPEFKNDFEMPLDEDFFEDIHNDSSINMKDALEQVDNEYEDVFAGFESNMNKILNGGSFMDDSMMVENEDPQHSLFNIDDEEEQKGEQVEEDLEKTQDSEKKTEKKELTEEEKLKRKEMFMNRYQFMITMMDELARDQYIWLKRNKGKMKPEMEPVNKMTEESVQKFTANRYKIFSMLCRGCMFYKTWYYKDSEGEKHGPFMGFDMDIWNAEGILKTDFLISPNDKTYLRYDMFNERDNSIMDLMHDVIREQERILRMNELKMREEQLKKRGKKRGRGRSRGGRQRDKGYNRREWNKDRRYDRDKGYDRGYDRNRDKDQNRGYYRDKGYQKDHGEFYFKKKKKQKDYNKQDQKFEPKKMSFTKKKAPEEKVDEEEFPTLGAEQIEMKPNTSEIILNLKDPPQKEKIISKVNKDKNSQNFKKKNLNVESKEIVEIGFENPDDIPEISKKVNKDEPKINLKTEKKNIISSWDMEIKVVKKGKKKKKRKKARAKKKEEEKNEELTDGIKKMLNI